MSTPIIFNGNIPENYEQYLTRFLFDPYAIDLVQRVNIKNAHQVLELACGTGAMTKHLVPALPVTAQVKATDLEPGMLRIAKEKISFSNLSWGIVDMTDIPCADDTFDTILCQFGLMLVPEILKALKEVHRVLKKDGQLLFNVWGDIQQNEVWNIAGKVVESFIAVNPILVKNGPFSLDEKETRSLLKEAGFKNISVTAINKTGAIESASMAAKGFIEGLPVFMSIHKKDPSLLPDVISALETAFKVELGDLPMQSALQALVFEANK